jgi:exonuclease SbcC
MLKFVYFFIKTIVEKRKMVPLTLSIKNFLSYGPQTQTINFEPYNFICLCGRNGHGKSALLDAITWAIWGQARKISNQAKSDDILLHIGETAMMVCFEFIINHHQFRIRREYSYTKGKPSSALDFGIYDPASATLQALSEKTIRQTQEKINTMLGFTYDTFCNSIFLKQGASGEFSKKTPKERKDILCQLLNVDYYDAIHKKSVEKHRELVTQHTLLTQQAATKEVSEDALKSIEKNIEETIEQEKIISQQNTYFSEHEQKIKEAIATNLFTITKLEESKQQKESLEKSYQEIIVTIRELFKKSHDKKIGTRTHNHEDLRLITEKYQQKSIQAHLLEKKIISLKTSRDTCKKELLTLTLKAKDDYNKILRTLSSDCATTSNQCATIQKTLELKEIQKKQLSQELASLPEPIATLDHIQEQFEKTKQFYHRFVLRGQEVKKKYDTLAIEYIALDDIGSFCHACKQVLTEQHKKTMRTQFVVKKLRLERHISKIKQFLTMLKDRLTSMHARVTVLQACAEHTVKIISIDQEREQLAAQYKIIHATYIEIEARIKITEKELQSIEQSIITEKYLSAEDTYNTIYTELLAITDAYSALAYDREAHQHSIDLYTAAMSSTDRIHKRQILREKIMHARMIKKQLDFCHYDEQTYATALMQKQEHETELSTTSAKKLISAQEQERIVKQKNNLLHQLDMLTMQLSEHKKILQLCETIKSESDEYSALAQSLGKDGIQAVLIENAIPELEAEANELLTRLTDNQTYLNIESVRDLKSGKTKETLDITISDSIGTRSYELFSGGEAFRIDFALRIALAKLLARRSGTTLQTLIIDEGFGSQDEEGLQRIVEALYKIQDDFSKIIIVSHLPQLKNQFSTHFVVTKEARGSIITINQ